MTIPFSPLSEDEFTELEQFLLYDVDTEDVMALDMADGFLHAIAVGPTTIPPGQWLPKVWGTKEMMPPMDSIDQLNHMLGLVMRHFNSIIAGLEGNPREISPCWSTMTYEGDKQEYDDAEVWAYGFIEGMRLCWSDWQPLLSTPQAQALLRPIGLLGEGDFSVDQDELTRTPAMRAELALQIPQAVLDMHAHWLPLRHAVYQREVAKAMQPKVGRNEPCPCGSGKKFKQCCGAAGDLHRGGL
ncbi:UPF0149 family protein [Variovorax sp. J22G73]|uniref:UPF0149 family protein n=1 Tax=unclassified Variovorax TaxID=663243 RepID=UPI0025771900|nr:MULTISPECIES: UPF0149 family protein [unclassified Variovorax]MDM0101996.1 UPF0149 family protein [Variovorax sp. J22G73]